MKIKMNRTVRHGVNVLKRGADVTISEVAAKELIEAGYAAEIAKKEPAKETAKKAKADD